MFHILDDYWDKNRDKNEEKDKRKKTDSYAAGKSSGIAAENPEDDEWVKKIQKFEDKKKYDKKREIKIDSV